MEAVLKTHTAEQYSVPSSPNKQQIRFKIRNKGLLNPPPPPSRTVSSTSYTHLPRQNQQQPPLLPLPNVSTIHHHHPPLLARSLSSSGGGGQGQGLSSRKLDRANRDHASLTAKKSKPPKKRSSAATQSISDYLMVAHDNNNNRWGPDPKDLPKHLPVVLTMRVPMDDVAVMSPPPSSLPLPKFSILRPKLSCNAEAAGVDAGATNNLRRLLRLR